MEGYSKLAVEIGDLSGNRVSAEELLECVKSLIGMLCSAFMQFELYLGCNSLKYIRDLPFKKSRCMI